MKVSTPLRPALVIALLLVPAPAAAQRSDGTRDAATRVDQVFAPYAVADAPGCAVAVAENGRTVLTRAYGMADLEHDVPNTPLTVFEAGSVSKQFTVAAIMLLVQDGLLSLDDDVRNHVPELPAYTAPITIRHLIHHTSGLRDWGTVVAAGGWPRTTRVHTHDHVLDVLSRQRELNYEPGAEYSYTNSGYNLMAIIVERLSGEPFAEFTRRRLFQPIGMHRTEWRDDFTRVVKGRAQAYVPVGGETGFRLLMPFENVHGNGGLLTTVGDLLLWNENLETGVVGGRDLVEALHVQGRLNDDSEIMYAGGLMIQSYRGLPRIGHGGATAGYRAYLARFPNQRLSVALLCNRGDASAEALASRVADAFLEVGAAQAMAAAAPQRSVGPRPAARQAAAAELASYVGTYYSDEAEVTYAVALGDDGLELRRRPAAVMKLQPVAADTFAIPGSFQVRFSRDAHGRIAAMHFGMGRVRDLRLQRIEPGGTADGGS